jgi:hypothetical protein
MMKANQRVKFWHYGKMFEGDVAAVRPDRWGSDEFIVSFCGESLEVPHPDKWTLLEWTEHKL